MSFNLEIIYLILFTDFFPIVWYYKYDWLKGVYCKIELVFQHSTKSSAVMSITPCYYSTYRPHPGCTTNRTWATFGSKLILTSIRTCLRCVLDPNRQRSSSSHFGLRRIRPCSFRSEEPHCFLLFNCFKRKILRLKLFVPLHALWQ